MDKSIGFTGTSEGSTTEQLQELEKHLTRLKAAGFVEFHHGLCIGADEQAAEIAAELGYCVIAHPGFAEDSFNLERRSGFMGNDRVMEAKPFADRDRDIVNATDRLLASPRTRLEEIGSGTWATVRYAQGLGKPVDLILPTLT